MGALAVLVSDIGVRHLLRRPDFASALDLRAEKLMDIDTPEDFRLTQLRGEPSIRAEGLNDKEPQVAFMKSLPEGRRMNDALMRSVELLLTKQSFRTFNHFVESCHRFMVLGMAKRCEALQLAAPAIPLRQLSPPSGLSGRMRSASPMG